MKLEIETTSIFIRNFDSTKRYVINQGGTRSSKTYSINQTLWYKASLDTKAKTYSIVSETMPHLKRGAMKDFFDFLIRYNLYIPKNHNKTDSYYIVGKSKIEFFSADSMDKVHGPGRDVLFCNEIQNIGYETFFHLAQRTNDQIYADFNPTHEFWIYPEFLNNPDYEGDIDYIHSTIFDNPFVSKAIKKDVLRRANRDDNYRRIYLEGVPGVLEGLIFTFQQIDQVPDNARLVCYGLDFGFSVDPTALVAVYLHGNNIYLDEKIYQTELTNADLSAYFNSLGIKKRSDEIFADSSEPKSITELNLRGYNVKPVHKGADSIRAGIDIMKQYNLFLTKQSVNGIKEMRSYSWIKDKDGRATNKPTDMMNHFVDAARYGIMMKLGKLDYSKISLT